MTLWFVLCLVFFVSWGKVLSALKSPPPKSEALLYFASPTPSTASFFKMKRIPRGSALRVAKPIIRSALVWGFFTVIAWTLYFKFVRDREMSMLLRSYFATMPLYLLSETLSALFQLSWIPAGYDFPTIHRHPILAGSVSEFWGKRWNTWVADWLRQMIFVPMRNRPVFALFVAFGFSGLLHEFIINVPLEALHGVNNLGSMMIFFPLQAVGIVIEKRIGAGHAVLQRALVWLIIFVPAPLIFNEGILRIFFLYR